MLRRAVLISHGLASGRARTGKRIVIVVSALAACCLFAGSAFAADDAETQKRLKALERQVGQLTKLVQDQQKQLKATRQDNEELKAKLNDKDFAAIKAAVAKDADKKVTLRQNMWANLDIQLYGKIKADMSVDTSRTSTGDFARWVESEETNSNDHEMNITANETRLGLRVNGPDIGEAKTSGVVEMDFYGGGAENKANPMMRHAFMKIDWAKLGLSLIAGQTWDVISPLNPTTLNYSVQWWAGNIGYRRPQIRLTKVCDLGGGTSLKFESAIARDIGHDSGFGPGDSGEDSSLPCFQGRASLTFPFVADRKATVGVSGHYAREQYDLNVNGKSTNADSWSANLDMDFPFLSWLRVKCEMYTGQDLDAYLGGIGQGVVFANRHLTEIQSTGGWLAASLGPWGPWSFNVGFSGEFIDDGDLVKGGLINGSTAVANGRTCNTSIFGNAIYKINDNTSVGVEISRWRTDYKGEDAGDSLRVQTSFIYHW